MTRIAARLALFVLALSAGCGGGGGGSSDAEHGGVDAFPDVLEIARAELGDTAPLVEVTVSENAISFTNVQIGRTVRVTYNAKGVFTGNAPGPKRIAPTAVFSITEVPADAPAKLLAAIQERESESVSKLVGTLTRNRQGRLAWRAKATVGGATKEYEAAADGSLLRS